MAVLHFRLQVTTALFILLWARVDGLSPLMQQFTRRIVVQGHLATENVIAAWYSSMLLLAVAAMACLAWLVDRPAVTSVILGARTMEQLKDNLGAIGLHLSAEETARLDAASDPGAADYPYGGHGTHQRNRTVDPAEWLASAP